MTGAYRMHSLGYLKERKLLEDDGVGEMLLIWFLMIQLRRRTCLSEDRAQ
jgi:hypothetical protein